MKNAQTEESSSIPDWNILSTNVLKIIRILRSASGAFFTQANLHSQLIKVEWEEGKTKILKLLMSALLGFVCFICFLLFLGLLIVAIYWDTPYRIVSILILCSLYGLGALIAWKRVCWLTQNSNGFFPSTREELAADAALIKSKL